MRVLVWQWGRRGAAPRYAVALARALDALPDVTGLLSLSRQAEIMQPGPDAPRCDLPLATYTGAVSYAVRLLRAPFAVGGLVRRLRALRPDVAVCAMPGPLDLLMAAALRRLGVPFVVVVHDADAHPGDGLPLQMTLQARLLRRAAALVALTAHVAARLEGRGKPVLRSVLPPLDYGVPAAPPGAHGGRPRLLSFGRLLPYKGLDLLADALRLLPPGLADIRVVGSGPESAALDALRALPDVTVENRWVPEAEVGALLAWADIVVLSHTEASQSGVAAAALAAGRRIVATRVGGIVEQLRDAPDATLCAPEPETLAAMLRRALTGPFAPPASSPGAGAAWLAMAEDLARQLRSLPVRISAG